MWRNIGSYYLLYAFVILLSYFKQKKEFKVADPSTPASKFKWANVFFISNEIIYTAAGVIIALINSTYAFSSIIVPILLIIVVFSTNISSMSDKFNERNQLYGHLATITLVVVGTFITFRFCVPDPEAIKANCPAPRDTTYIYSAAIPYCDNSLIDHVGYKIIGKKYFMFCTKVTAKNEAEATTLAIKRFWADSLIAPYNKDTMDKRTILDIDKDYILIKQLR